MVWYPYESSGQSAPLLFYRAELESLLWRKTAFGEVKYIYKILDSHKMPYDSKEGRYTRVGLYIVVPLLVALVEGGVIHANKRYIHLQQTFRVKPWLLKVLAPRTILLHWDEANFSNNNKLFFDEKKKFLERNLKLARPNQLPSISFVLYFWNRFSNLGLSFVTITDSVNRFVEISIFWPFWSLRKFILTKIVKGKAEILKKLQNSCAS